MKNEEEKQQPSLPTDWQLKQWMGLPDSYFQKEYKPDRRDYFTAAALTGLLGNPSFFQLFVNLTGDPELAVELYDKLAMQHADDIIKRLNETK
jgi:hypothetical protein